MITRITICLLGFGLLFPLSCVSRLDEKTPATNGVGDKSTPTTGAPATDDAVPGPNDSCGDQACVSNTDCCKGFVCGFDQERSEVQRYCMSG